MVKALSSCRPDEIMDISHGFHLLRDGNAWVAVGPALSTWRSRRPGFGDTKGGAIKALQVEMRKAGYPDHAIPTMETFTVHDDDK
jgi:hypothetical protein